MLFVDASWGVLLDAECKERVAAAAPSARWAADGLRPVTRGRAVQETPPPDELERRQAVYGYSKEELAMVLKAMANDAKEPTFSMGDDAPLPPLAGRPRPIHHYLRQRFAQVTNPPIDHLRERLVMSLRTLLGPRRPLLLEEPEAARLIALDSFFVYPSAIRQLVNEDRGRFDPVLLDATFAVADGPEGLHAAVEGLAAAADAAVAAGAGLL